MNEIIEKFNELYYNDRVWERTYYKGLPIAKTPADLWMYQQIIWDTQPNLIIETGTGYGGSALFLKDMLKLMCPNDGQVITVDINKNYIKYPGIIQLQGSSVNDGILRNIYVETCKHIKVMIILDSSHTYEHVSIELEEYSKLVSDGCYLIVEDTNNELYRVGRGAKEAVEDWLEKGGKNNFEVDKQCERFMLTFNPSGYLRRYR